MSSWQATVAARLRKRDAVERDCVVSIVDAHSRLQRRNEQLEKSLVLIRQSSGGGSGAEEALKQQCVELKDTVQKLQLDLLTKYKTEAQISTSALSANQESQALQNQLKIVELELAQRSQAFEAAETKVSELEDKMNSQESQLMLYRDELKRLRQTRDESDKKVTELTQDNQVLLQRMLEDKQRLSEELNRMNTLYERLRAQAGVGTGGSSASVIDSTGGAGSAGAAGAASGRSGESKSNGGGNGGVDGRSSTRSTVPKEAKMWTKAHDTKVNAVVCSPDGTQFGTASDDGTIKLWLTAGLSKGPSGKLMQSRSNVSPIVCLDWTSTYVVGGSTDRAATLWDVRTEREHVRLAGHKGKVLACKFVGQSGRHIVTGSADASIRLWDTRQGFTTRTIGCSSVCNALDVGADGTTCTSGHMDGVVRTWDLRNGKSLHEIRGVHEMSITSVNFAPSTSSAHLLLTLSRENKIRTFDTITWESIRTLEHEQFVVGATTTKAVFSSDAVYAAAGSSSGHVFVWDVTTGELVKTLEKHQSVVTGITWRQDGRLMFSTDQRGYVVVWA
jgi:autophagy-related protein 16